MVRFANQIAQAISDDHPDVLIHTFAYQYTEQPPRITKPDPNVVIMLCSIQCCQYHRYDQCPHNEAFLNHLQRWSTLTQRLYIWHYNTNFRHYLLPFPDLRQLPHSLKLYREHHVKGLIAQGMEPGGRGFMDELKSYLVAKLLWDASLDPQAIRTEFLHAYFAESADPMDAFLRLLHDRVGVEDIHGTCFDDLGLTGRSHPFSPGGKAVPLMTDDVVAQSRRLFAEAKDMVRDPAVLARLERVEFSLDYFETMRRFHQAAKGIAMADAWRQVQALADRSRQLGFAEWTMGRGSIERRLETMKATFDRD